MTNYFNTAQFNTEQQSEAQSPFAQIPKTEESSFISLNATDQERIHHYLRVRWRPQVNYYEAKGADSKNKHLYTQIIVGVGSVLVTVFLAIGFGAQWVALLSGVIAAAAAVENVQKYGENWRRFRQASEGLKREKVMFDMKVGHYRTTKNAVLLFTERCEDVIAQETGRYFQREEQQQQKGDGQAQSAPDGKPATTLQGSASNTPALSETSAMG
jgi:hypothetical protein